AAYASLVTWLARNNAPDEARQVYQEAKERNLESPGARWGLGMALWNRGNVDEAQAEFRRLQQGEAPYESIGRIYLSRTLTYQGRLLDAIEQLESGIRRDKAAKNEAPELLQRYLLAQVAVQQGNRAAAHRELI